MHEDPYTGRLFDDFEDLDPTEEDLTEWEDEDFDEIPESDTETAVDVISVVEGAKTLQDIAERLYVYADELLSLAALGWELMDDIVQGEGIALLFDGEDDDIDGLDGL
jgi:hypothetical protein